MAGPITWQNINTRQPDVSNLLSGAVSGIDRAFGKAKGLLDDHVQTQADARDKEFKDNTAAFKDALAGYATPEALQAAQQNGEIDALMKSFNGRIDPDAVRGLPQQHLASLRQQATAGQNYQDQQTQYKNRDFHSALNAQARGDLAGALVKLGESDVVDKAGAEERLRGINRQAITDGRTEAKYQEGLTLDSLMQHAIKNSDSEFTARQMFMEQGAQAGISAGALMKSLDTLSTGYGDLRGFTKEEQAANQQEQLIASHEADIEKSRLLSAKEGYQTELNNIPEFARIDQPKMSEGELVKQVLQDFKVGSFLWTDNREGQTEEVDLTQRTRDVVDKAQKELKALNITTADPAKIVYEAMSRVNTKNRNDNGVGVMDFVAVGRELRSVIQEYEDHYTKQETYKAGLTTAEKALRELPLSLAQRNKEIETRRRNERALKNSFR